jgi:excisionase family DNA binding protein
MTQVHSIPEACALARAGRTAVYQAINSGNLVAHKRGRRTLIFACDLQRWLDSLPQIEVKNAKQDRGAVSGTARATSRAPERRKETT